MPTSLAVLLEALEADDTSILNGFMRRIDGRMMADSSMVLHPKSRGSWGHIARHTEAPRPI
jgi:hypothetical protein